MNLQQLVLTLRAHWRVALAVFALTVGASLALSWAMPRQYRATASVVIDTSRADPIGATVSQSNPSAAFMATQVDVLRSERVAERVIQDLQLSADPTWRQRWQAGPGGAGSPADSGRSMSSWLREALMARLDVKPARESNVISVSFTDEQPEQAARLANGFVQAYLNTSLDMRVEPARRFAAFFETRAATLRGQLEQAQARLGAFQREVGISASDERLDVETARLGELSSQLTTLQALASDSRSRAVQAQSDMAEKLPEVLNNPLLVELSGETNRAAAHLDELRTRLGDNNPQVQQAAAQASALRSRLENETRRVAGGAGVNLAINRQRMNEAQAQLQAQRQKVAQIRAGREQASVIQRDVDNARRAYDTVLARWSQAELESQATPGQLHVLNPALVPTRAASPKTVLNAALAALAGLLLALGTALALEWADPRVRSLAALPAALGLPVLGVMSSPQRAVAGPAWGGGHLIAGPR